MSGAEHSSLAERWRHEGVLPGSASIRELWRWLADLARADAERLGFVGCSRSASRGKGPRARPAPGVVAEWLPLIAQLLDHEPRVVSRGRHAAVGDETPVAASEQEPWDAGRGGGQSAPTLVLAVVRGLLLDLLLTDDRARVQQAFDTFASVLAAINDAGQNAEPSG
jgi:hypothetical protein